MRAVALAVGMGMAAAAGPQVPEARMFAPQDVVAVDEALTVQLKGRTVKPLGLRPRDGRAARDMLERLLRTSQEIRLVPDEGAAGADAVYIEYVAMVDRTGPVWLDAGHVLVAQKVARVDTAVTFARRAAYEVTQRKAEQSTGPRYPND